MKIIADTTTLYSPKEVDEIGIKIIPACTIIDNEVYKDYEDISSEEFLQKVRDRTVATTSQSAIGEILEIFEETDEELLVLPIGDGLSGTYQNAMGAKNCGEDHKHIHVLNTKTLAGAQRYLVQKAKKILETIKLQFGAVKAELFELAPALITHGGPGCVVIQAIHR